jgi:hypothetical protein
MLAEQEADGQGDHHHADGGIAEPKHREQGFNRLNDQPGTCNVRKCHLQDVASLQLRKERTGHSRVPWLAASLSASAIAGEPATGQARCAFASLSVAGALVLQQLAHAGPVLAGLTLQRMSPATLQSWSVTR